MIAAAPVSNLKTALWRHQREAVAFASERPGALLALSMGHGKTLCALALLDAWDARTALILCPKSVVSVWPGEFERHYHPDHGWTVLPLDTGRVADRVQAARAALERGGRVAVVVNYEAAIQPAMASLLKSRAWDVVVGDELHRAKDHRGITARLMRDLGRKARRRLGLSGTPMPHSPLDIWAQARFLAPGVYGSSWLLFRNRYAQTHPMFPSKVLKYQHLDELEARLATFAYRSPADAVELPPATHVTRAFALSPKAARLYRDLEKDFTATLDAYGRGDASVTASNVLVKVLRLQQVSSGTLKDDDGTLHVVDDGKARVLADILADLAPDEPVVVFGRFHADLDTVHRVAASLGRASLELSGRHNDLAAWQHGAAPILAVQTQSGGVGISLVRARVCVYLSKSFALGDHEQSLARVRRPGQERPVLYLHVVARGTIDEKIDAALAARRDLVESLLEGLRR